MAANTSLPVETNNPEAHRRAAMLTAQRVSTTLGRRDSRLFLYLSALALLLTLQRAGITEDEPPGPQSDFKSPRLQLAFSDDFSRDSRGDYQTEGVVS